jgi:hypothetical protein
MAPSQARRLWSLVGPLEHAEEFKESQEYKEFK